MGVLGGRVGAISGLGLGIQSVFGDPAKKDRDNVYRMRDGNTPFGPCRALYQILSGGWLYAITAEAESGLAK